MPTKFADHVLTGDHASRPAASAVPEGTLYSCTDHNLIYQSDGASAWSTWSNPGAVTDAELAAIAGLTSAADKGIQFTGSGTAATFDLTAAGKALLDDANAAAQLTTLGAQPLDAELTAIAGLTSAADKGIQFTGSGTAATFDLTAAGKALLDDAAASDQRTTLGLGGAAVLNVGTSAGTVAAGDDSRFSSTPGSGIVPYMYPFGDAIDDPINDNFRVGDGAGSMDTSGTRFSGAQAWTARGQLAGFATVVASGRAWVTSAAVADAPNLRIQGWDTAVPSGNWCVRLRLTIRPAGTSTTQRSVGMYLLDTVSGEAEFWSIGWANSVPIMWAGRMTAMGTYLNTRYDSGTVTIHHSHFLEIEYDGTNYILRDGLIDGPLHRRSANLTYAATSHMNNVADRIGIFSQNNQSVATTGIFHGFYRVPVSAVL